MAGSLRFVLGLAAAGGEITTSLACWLWQHTAKSGRLDRHLERLERAGYIETTGPIDARILRLTAEGRRHAAGEVDPDQRWNRRWDGAWRIVSFDIPESHAALRVRLRRLLREFRFGYLQDSVWISPDAVDEFKVRLGERGIAPDSLAYFLAFPDGGEGAEALVSGAWNFLDLQKRYAAYRAILKTRPGRLVGSPATWIQWLHSEYRAWQRIVHLDPFLPAALLPKGYVGRNAWQERLAALHEFARLLPGC